MKYHHILEMIGHTPHIRLSRLFPDQEVWMKLEKNNPGGSLKDRIALAMVEDAEKEGTIRPGATIIEPTSGNTGIGLALVGTLKGYRVIIVMPDSMSVERRQLIRLFGAETVLTPHDKGMRGAIEKAEAIRDTIPGSWIPQQFENRSNPTVHAHTTAQEIIADFPEGIDCLIAGIGSGGHISGVGRMLKKKFPSIRIIGVEPADSPILSAGKAAAHAIQGIGAGFIPNTLDTDVPDAILTVTQEESYRFTRRLARQEGITGGISTGACLAAIARTIAGVREKKRILTFNYDSGERYLSVEGLF